MRPGLPRFSLCLPLLYCTECKPNNKKWGRPGNEARVAFLVQSSFVQKHCKWNSIAVSAQKGVELWYSHVFLDEIWKYSCTWVNFWAVFCVKPWIHYGSCCKLELVRARTMLVLIEQMQFVCRWLLTDALQKQVCYFSKVFCYYNSVDCPSLRKLM